MTQIAALAAHPRNYNRHSAGQVADLARSLTRFGQRKPVVTWRGVILAGHGLVEAARSLGWTEIWTAEAPEEWTEAEALAFVAADNELARAADPDLDALTALVAEVGDVDAELARLAAGGEEALKRLLASIQQPAGDDPGAQVDKAEELRVKWQTATAQLWQLGEHRLICGDCTDPATVKRVMDIQPGIMVTDPPYGVNYNPQWRSDAANAGHLSYAASRVGKVANDDRADWRDAWALFPGDVVYSWHPAGAPSLVHAQALQESGFVLRMQIIWAKSNFPIGRGDYHVRHEPCWYAVRDGKPARRTKDRTQTTLWEINLDKNVDGGHSTQKPLECMERPIRNHEFDVVYDPFCGSGTTIIACERLGRRCRAVEIEPGYVAVALERWATMTGQTPVLVDVMTGSNEPDKVS